jgi:uncharacterized protein (DUF1778 family)
MSTKKARRLSTLARPSHADAEERKAERVELRTTTDEKRLLVAAAAHEHLDVTAFVLRAALPAAREVVDRAATVQLWARDTEGVLDLLVHPAAPSPRLRRAADGLRANLAALAEHTPRSSRRHREPAGAPPRSPARGSRRRG